MSYSNIAVRYQHIKPILERFKRPFTVLDLGAFECAFGSQICADFPQATVIAVESETPRVVDAPEGLLYLRRKLSDTDMKALSECEHFDVTLCLNFLHHQGSDWFRFLTSVLYCSAWTIVQTPLVDDFGASGQGIVQEIGRFYAHYEPVASTVQFSGHMPRPIYVHHKEQSAILTRSSVSSPDNSVSAIVTHGDTEKKIILKHKDGKERQWVYGFNLENFLALGGIWPDKQRVIQMLREMPLPVMNHGDIATHNIIIDGRRAQLIDGGEEWATWDDRTNLEHVIAQVEERMP